MDAVSSPELQSLFHECPRLLRKLSSQEIRGLSNYVERRVQNDYAELLKNMTYLEMSRDDAERKYSRTMEWMQRETEKDRSLAQEYKRSYGNIAQVLTNKEVRFEGKYEDLLKELKRTEEDYETLCKAKSSLEEDLVKKDLVISDLYSDVSRLREKLEERSNHSDLIQETERMHREIMRLKLDLEHQKKENATLLKGEEKMKEELRAVVYSHAATSPRYPSVSESSVVKPIETDNGKLSVASAALLTRSPNTTSTLTTYNTCSGTNCRAKKDLDECRSELAKKCQENAYLSHLLAQARARDPDNVTVRKLGLDFYEPRTSLLDRKTYRNSSSSGSYNSLARSPATSVNHASNLTHRPSYK